MYGLASTVDFWSEYGMFNALIMSGGAADPAELESHARRSMIAKYTTRICLGAGLICITLGLFQMIRLASAQIVGNSNKT